MSEIILKVPEGDKCVGCMFLDLEYFSGKVRCKLFDVELWHQTKYGDIEETTITKCGRCPRSEI